MRFPSKVLCIVVVITSVVVANRNNVAQTDSILDGLLPADNEETSPDRKKEFDDRNHNIGEIARENHFPYEKHRVHTSDGYILQLDRITPQGGVVQQAPVVLLIHGVEDSSLQWVINSADRSFAFMLAREGYDVWLGNNRGNDFSLGHETLSSKDQAYWDFDFEEMGLCDLPAFIDYILAKTKKSKIDAYIAHSQGTTEFFIGASMEPAYFAEKVGLFIGLAPVARLEHSTNQALVYISQYVDQIVPVIQTLGIYNLMSFYDGTKWINGLLCKNLPELCQIANEGFWEWNDDVDNLDRVGDKMAHAPAGCGWRNLAHYAQIFKDKKFGRYNFGKEKNKEVYGHGHAPTYDLGAITVPMALYHGDVDKIADPTDVSWLLDEQRSGLQKSMVVHEESMHFAHNSFTGAKNMSYVNDSVIPLIEKSHSGTLFTQHMPEQ